MSDPSLPARDSWAWLAPSLRPRSEEERGTGSTRLVESTVLVLIALLLAVATVNDIAREVGINHRLVSDLSTWRHYTHHDYHDLSADQELLGIRTHRDVVCGNVSPGPPKERTQICLVVTGPKLDGLRSVVGGWYLPAHVEDDVYERRYGCFGSVTRGLCPR
jgi:hypothetical protein